MRTLAELPHADYKITLFGMNQKFIIKFEQGTLEQTYKIAETDVVGGVDGVFQLLDQAFLDKVTGIFVQMRSEFIQAYDRNEG